MIQNVFPVHKGIKLSISITEDSMTISNIWILKNTSNNTWTNEKVSG